MIYRNPLQPYSPAVIAWTFACLCALCYAWAMAFFWDRTPLATWGHDET